MQTRIETGDITEFTGDAIVNAANTSLLGGGGVDGAIHAAAGPGLLDACRLLNGCDTGDAKWTEGFALPARYVIHTVGPIYQGGGSGEAALLERCYRRSLEVAETLGVQSIAFPAISTGIYGYPLVEATEIAIGTVLAFAAEHVDETTFMCFDALTAERYRDVYDRLATSRD